MVLRLAWRNLWRNRRRTLINLSAAGFGLFLVIVAGGLIRAMGDGAKHQLDDAGVGHVELAAPGWHTRRQVRLGLDDPSALLAKLSLPPGAEVSARVVARGLASSAHGAQGIVVHGVDPAAEQLVASYVTDVRQGAPLAGDDDKGVLVADKLAERLHVSVGQKLRLMAQRADGEVGAELFRVRGIFHPIAPSVARSQVVVTTAAAQRLLGLGRTVQQIVIQLPDPDSADAVAAAARVVAGPGVEVLTWGQLLPLLEQIEKIIGVYEVVIGLFVYLLVGLGILNTMLMSVLERTRELGVLRALGARPNSIITLVAAESFWIATLAVAIGVGLGVPLVAWGEGHVLFDYSSAMGEGADLGGSTLRAALHTQLSVPAVLKATLVVYVVTLLAGLWPARRISKLAPATALRAT